MLEITVSSQANAVVALHLNDTGLFSHGSNTPAESAMESCRISLKILETVAELSGAGNVEPLFKIAPHSRLALRDLTSVNQFCQILQSY